MKKRFSPRSIFFLVFLLFFLLIGSSGAWARTFSHIIAFGDSLTDHGGLSGYLPGALEVWSNGDVWVEYMADDWNADLENNAIAGAMTMGHENSDIQAMSDANQLPPLGLVGQVNTFIAGSPEFDAYRTLFTIWIGGNDLLEFGRGEYLDSNGQVVTDPGTMIALAMSHINTAMTALVDNGALYILVMNLPDVGLTPLYNGDETAAAGATQLSISFNKALDDMIADFKAAHPDVRVYTFDVFTYLHEMVESGIFKDTTGSYMVLDEQGNRTGETNEPAEDHLFWDSIHPTTKAHKLLGDKVAVVVADADDDDNSVCFISTSRAEGIPSPLFPFIVLASGICVLFIRRVQNKA